VSAKSAAESANTVRPLILAGGLGTRLRPRTEHLPKPLLPVAGRPLLWHAANSVSQCGLLPPIVSLDYKAELIQAYFEGSPIEFRCLPGRSMAEAVFEIADGEKAEAFLGMSSDVLVPRRAVQSMLDLYVGSGLRDAALFVRMPTTGHKKWEFSVSNGKLRDIVVRETKTNFERVLLVLKKESLDVIRKKMPSPILETTLPADLSLFQTGWILLLKGLLRAGLPVAAEIVDIPVCNINVLADFQAAEKFISGEMG